jgi:hypothetical protein
VSEALLTGLLASGDPDVVPPFWFSGVRKGDLKGLLTVGLSLRLLIEGIVSIGDTVLTG